MRAYLDTNILIRHLTGTPVDQAERATSFLQQADELILTDLVFAETLYVLRSFYEVPRDQLPAILRPVLAFRAVVCDSQARLLRALAVFEFARLGFAEAYLISCAEEDAGAGVASFDRAIDRVGTVPRIEP